MGGAPRSVRDAITLSSGLARAERHAPVRRTGAGTTERRLTMVARWTLRGARTRLWSVPAMCRHRNAVPRPFHTEVNGTGAASRTRTRTVITGLRAAAIVQTLPAGGTEEAGDRLVAVVGPGAAASGAGDRTRLGTAGVPLAIVDPGPPPARLPFLGIRELAAAWQEIVRRRLLRHDEAEQRGYPPTQQPAQSGPARAEGPGQGVESGRVHVILP